MKKIKLLLAAFAAIVSLGAQAGSDWVAPSAPAATDPVSGGTYKIRNVGSGQYLTGGAAWFSWPTSAVLGDVNSAHEWTITTSGNGYTLSCNRSGNNKLFTSGNNNEEQCMHVDGASATTYLLEKQASGYYRMRQDGVTGKYVGGPDNKGGILAQIEDTEKYGANSCDWEFVPLSALTTYGPTVSYAEMRAKVLAIVNATDVYTDANDAAATLLAGVYAQDDIVDAATTAAEVNTATATIKALVIPFVQSVTIKDGKSFDITDFALTNPGFELGNMDGWTNSGSQSLDAQGNKAYGNVQGSYYAERWHAAGDINLSQTVANLPAGYYELKAYLSTGGGGTGTFAGNDSQVNFAADMQYSLIVHLAEAGNLTIQVTGPVTNSSWFCVDGFTLAYLGTAPLAVFQSDLAAAVATAKSHALSLSIPAAALTAYLNAITAAEPNNSTIDDCLQSIEDIASATSTADALVSPYANYLLVKSYVEALDDDETIYSGDATLDLSAGIEAEAATTVEGISAAVAKLRTAATNFVTSVTVNEGKYFDMTNLWIVNPTVSQNVDGWNSDNVVRAVSWGTGPTTNYGETEFYQSTFDFNQSVTLPRGTFEFGVTGFHRAGNHSTYFYAGEDKVQIPGVESSVVNSMAEAKTYFDSGNGKLALKFGLEGDSNTLKIGIINNDTETDRWTIFRNFTIHYFGSAVDYSIYVNRWNDAVDAANEALVAAEYKYVSGNERINLADAIEDAPNGSSKANYIEKIDALEAATLAFKAAAPSYNAYVLYKTEVKNLWGSYLGVSAPNTAEEAATVIQNLKVAQYNKVADEYKYSLTSKIGDFSTWTGTAQVGNPREAGTPNSLDWEHWSGTTHPYYEQDNNGYNNEGGWTIQYEKTTTLPAGNYVVKVAARSSRSVTSSISITANEENIAPVISLPCVDNRARGIAKDGTASWSDDKEYILDNQGGGWEWRFVPFALDAETTVTMKFYAEASSKYQWMSIADGELLSTEDIATAVAYNETATNFISDEDLANVTITRNIKEGFNTVVLPFDLTLGQVEAAFGSGTQVYAFSENSENPDEVTINFNKVNAGTISANVPVLINATVASSSQTFNGVEVVAALEAKVSGTNFDFIGTYAPISVPEFDYFVGKGAIYRSEGATNINAFRAYIHDKTGSGAGVKFFIGGQPFDYATAVNGIDAAPAQNSAIYNIAGQRVSKAQKGIFIVNGKKVVK